MSSGKDLHAPLLAWYRRHKRALPWRATRDPYAIWISEAMLQQTRVETVIGYWSRFLERFPTARELAAAREEDVLAAWSGLGYYRRARALRAAARAIVARHGGEFPRDAGAVRELPGVGPYTAGAVLSIAFGAPEALVDGNVVRVLSRLRAHDAEAAAATRWAWELARELVPADGSAGDWNQALMELGATVCTPREPKCLTCPVAGACEARRKGLQAELPRARKRPEPIEVELASFVVESRGKLLLEQRPAGGRMAGLWQLPTLQLSPERGTRLFPAELGLAIEAGEELASLRHTITRHRIRVRLLRGRATGAKPPFRRFSRDEIASLAITGMTRKALAKLAPTRAATAAE
jgi:A/G-specific adenine glycosylase